MTSHVKLPPSVQSSLRMSSSATLKIRAEWNFCRILSTSRRSRKLLAVTRRKDIIHARCFPVARLRQASSSRSDDHGAVVSPRNEARDGKTGRQNFSRGSPNPRKHWSGLVAQLVEQCPFKALVRGSSPRQPTTSFAWKINKMTMDKGVY